MYSRLVFFLAVALTAGCQGYVGPFRRAADPQPVDYPWLTTDEQQQRYRDRVGLPDVSAEVGPRTFNENPQVRGVR